MMQRVVLCCDMLYYDATRDRPGTSEGSAAQYTAHNRIGAAPQSLRAAQVDLCVVRVADQATGVAFISVADDGQNAITVAPGANAALLPAHLPPLQGISHLLLQLETPLPTVTGSALAVPEVRPVFDAVTVTVTALSRSATTGAYVAPVAPAIGAPSRDHW